MSPMIDSGDIDAIRQGNSPSDNEIIGGILKGPNGLSYRKGQSAKKSAADIYFTIGFSALDWRNEASYTAGYVNSVVHAAVDLIRMITPLAKLENVESATALGILLELSKKFGASNYLSYKLAYFRSAWDLSANELDLVSQIEDEIRHRDSAALHFSALENVSSKISLFVVAQRRISGLVSKVGGDFRRSLTLSNFVPTPLDDDDAAGFLLRATESSLVDTVYAIVTVFNLAEKLPGVHQELATRLSPEFMSSLNELIKFASDPIEDDIVTDVYKAQDEYSDYSLALYRVSAAFLERPKSANFRNKLDRVVGVRLLAEIVDASRYSCDGTVDDKAALLASNFAVLGDGVTLDSFYRTYLFLRFIVNRANLLTLSQDEVRYIFENTIELESLLTEKEMRTLYLTADPKTKSLVAVLALALFRKRSIDPDIDFAFRSDFISYVVSKHHGSIPEFINYLLDESPQVANYIVVSLDEVTLEKMYTLVKNASIASEIRCEILKAVGQRLNSIQYIIEAEAITTRVKVSSLKQYFDSSRMYVDSISMKKWLDGNPTMFTEQYRSLYPTIQAQIPPAELDSDIANNRLLVSTNGQDEYLVLQIAKDAFEQFCMNAEFGIHSYLGRRIRHNTLDGVTMDTVDTVLNKKAHSACMSHAAIRRSIDNWLASYRAIVDKLRREHLQFKAAHSLFKSTLDPADPVTQANLRQLRFTLRTTGASELLNDLVIAFCWKQITPQLENAARFIRTTLLREANSSIDKAFLGHHGSAETQLKADLHEAVNEVFKKVADWFQVPQTGFVSATGRELAEIIRIDLSLKGAVQWSGNAVDTKFTGISVHRLYDCLAVLLQNAAQYSAPNSLTSLDISSVRKPGTTMDYVTVEIATQGSDNSYEYSKQRILAAVAAEEAAIDMVTEGYTGIKKIKFITRTSEGVHTVGCASDDVDKVLKLSFRLHAEAANPDSIAAAA